LKARKPLEYKYYSRARSIKTRIETIVPEFGRHQFPCIREQDPLKQGLKQSLPSAVMPGRYDSRARSIKTRIETSNLTNLTHEIVTIREQDPLKQGLKLVIAVCIDSGIFIREQDPLKQGLKLIQVFHGFLSSEIREQDPLKQGLKHRSSRRDGLKGSIFESKIH